MKFVVTLELQAKNLQFLTRSRLWPCKVTIERVKVSDAPTYGSNGRFIAIPVVIFDYINSAFRIAFLLAILCTRRAIRVAASLNLLHFGHVTFELLTRYQRRNWLIRQRTVDANAFDWVERNTRPWGVIWNYGRTRNKPSRNVKVCPSLESLHGADCKKWDRISRTIDRWPANMGLLVGYLHGRSLCCTWQQAECINSCTTFYSRQTWTMSMKMALEDHPGDCRQIYLTNTLPKSHELTACKFTPFSYGTAPIIQQNGLWYSGAMRTAQYERGKQIAMS